MFTTVQSGFVVFEKEFSVSLLSSTEKKTSKFWKKNQKIRDMGVTHESGEIQ